MDQSGAAQLAPVRDQAAPTRGQRSGDPSRIRQVLLNLISNAIKFTPDGLVEVRTTSTASADGEHLIRFEIQDSGVGIPKAAMDRMFKAFSQADAPTSRDLGGLALGFQFLRSS